MLPTEHTGPPWEWIEVDGQWLLFGANDIPGDDPEQILGASGGILQMRYNDVLMLPCDPNHPDMMLIGASRGLLESARQVIAWARAGGYETVPAIERLQADIEAAGVKPSPEEPEDLSPEALQDLLSLADHCIALHTIGAWTDAERTEAAAWANNTVALAGDNTVICVPSPPRHVKDAPRIPAKEAQKRPPPQPEGVRRET